MNAPMYISVIFSVTVLLLPNFSSPLFFPALFLVLSIGFFLPFVSEKSRQISSSGFLEIHHPVGKKFIALHGLVFLVIFQIFALLGSIDYLLAQFFGEAHNIFLIGMIVFAGVVSVTGRAVLFSRIQKASGIAVLAGLIVLLINTLFFHFPLFVGLSPQLFVSQHRPELLASISLTSFTSVIALSVIVYWLMWMELSESRRKGEVRETPPLLRSAGMSSLFLIGLFMLFQQDYPAVPRTMTGGGSAVNIFVSFSFVMGLIGVFVLTFSSIGDLFSRTMYPQFRTPVGKEKEALLNKLATVFSVILSILLIPVARNTGAAVISWYGAYLALFTAPIVTAYFFSRLSKRNHPAIVTGSMLTGEIFVILAMGIRQLSATETQAGGIENISAIIFGGTVTAVVYVLMEKASDMITVKKILSRFGGTNSV